MIVVLTLLSVKVNVPTLPLAAASLGANTPLALRFPNSVTSVPTVMSGIREEPSQSSSLMPLFVSQIHFS